jgi:glycosyltransferase involved in cell wall biosynthesis
MIAELPAVHLINPLGRAGGSEMRTLALARRLAPLTRVSVWSDRALQSDPERCPREGTFVFVGSYFQPGPWLERARPGRLVIVVNLLDFDGLVLLLSRAQRLGWPPAEIVCCSLLVERALAAWLDHFEGPARRLFDPRRCLRLPPVIHSSFVDVDRFRPATARDRSPALTLGRHSRDEIYKHHPADPELYRSARALGYQLQLLGARCLAPALAGEPDVALLAEGTRDPAAFLAGLDVFVYRTAPGWTEPSGRVVEEAMACGLPVVCERRGGHCEIVRDGEDGFLFDDQDGARAVLRALREDHGLRARVGAAARTTALRLAALADRQIGWYLG